MTTHEDLVVEMVVEIPKGSRNKYEIDHETGAIWLDRHLFTATMYPADYGYIEHTLGEDGDPLDALVLVNEPTFPGCHLWVRPIGVFWMQDEKGPDAKILCVPARDPRFNPLKDLTEVDSHLLAEIAHFFEVYKDLEPSKDVNVAGWEGRAKAEQEILDAIERLKTEGH